ncbi:hypothetical protein D9M69_708720 [compost metagenome]
MFLVDAARVTSEFVDDQQHEGLDHLKHLKRVAQGRLGDICASIDGQRDDPFLFHHIKYLAHHRAADAVDLADGCLLELGARLELPVDDRVP